MVWPKVIPLNIVHCIYIEWSCIGKLLPTFIAPVKPGYNNHQWEMEKVAI